MLAKSDAIDVFVVDSVTVFVSEVQLDGETGDSQVGLVSKRMCSSRVRIVHVDHSTATRTTRCGLHVLFASTVPLRGLDVHYTCRYSVRVRVVLLT